MTFDISMKIIAISDIHISYQQITGATIQVASEMLPNSTERAVTVSGTSESITKCIYQICCVMMEVSHQHKP